MTDASTPPIAQHVVIGCLSAGQPNLATVESILGAQRDLGVSFYFTHGRLYLDDARTDQVNEFMSNSALASHTHLLLVDDDISFTTEDLERLWWYGHTSPWTSAMYPNIDGRVGRIVCAYNLADADPDDYDTLPVFEDGKFFDPIPLDKAPWFPTFVDSVGAGMMLLSRDFLTDMASKYPPPNPWFDEPVIQGVTVDGDGEGEKVVKNIHVGEDHGFALKAGAMGVRCLLAPVAVTHHKKVALIIPPPADSSPT